MKQSEININDITFPLYSVNTMIIGSGAASLNTAVNLFEKGQKDIMVVTDQLGGGTSNNTGSDKQTYYKLSVSGDTTDSPIEMAKDLFKGGCMHGDIALCEAMNSVQGFFHLISIGVPFPHNKYGAYVGYKTDHDPRQRATSCGPLTSHLMFEALAESVKEKNIKILDQHQVIALLTTEIEDVKHVIGAIALNKQNIDSENMGFVIIKAVNTVLGTGGPAGIYKTSVYPESQLGCSGLAYEIGAIGNNLTESQFGLASTKFRWNLSGTYQQVIPRYISTNQDGSDEKEFLNEYFPTMGKLATAIFLKGYQWPFDPRKVHDYGSSLIDILVYQESVMKGRRVFLDFKKNPSGCNILEDFSFKLLSEEAYSYLEKSGALLSTPIERLQKMNQPAIDLYKDHDIDLTQEYLEIAVCAQHNNGGLKSNLWWESNIKHLFPVGEVNGTHGVYRPGGSALNSGQVGGLRAALYIAKRYNVDTLSESDFISIITNQVQIKFDFARNLLHSSVKKNLKDVQCEYQSRMSQYGAHIREIEQIKIAVKNAWNQCHSIKDDMKVESVLDLPHAFRNLDLCLTHAIYLEAIQEYLEKGGQSRGSYLVMNADGEKPCKELSDRWKFKLTEPDDYVNNKILEISVQNDATIRKEWVDIRPIPEEELWFENIWNEFLRDEIIR